MKIGYPCINRSIGCTSNKTFRLKSYSEEKMITTISNNLLCLKKILQYNINHNIFFFRISSDLVPFASHPICIFKWQHYFKNDFKEIGEIINQNKIRISMHPDQFIVLNSIKEDVVKRSINELIYHAEVLDLFNLDFSAKIQLHIGGAYGDKKRSMQRFIDNYLTLNEKIKKRLIIENDDKIYSVKDCLMISEKTHIPVLFDTFHHCLLNYNESIKECIYQIQKTWQQKDGIPMVDYSSQQPNSTKGKHAESIDLIDFIDFINQTKPTDLDIMLEIKNKEKSAQQAEQLLRQDKRFYHPVIIRE